MWQFKKKKQHKHFWCPSLKRSCLYPLPLDLDRIQEEIDYVWIDDNVYSRQSQKIPCILFLCSCGMITPLESFFMESSYHAENTNILESPHSPPSESCQPTEVIMKNKNLSGNKSFSSPYSFEQSSTVWDKFKHWVLSSKTTNLQVR